MRKATIIITLATAVLGLGATIAYAHSSSTSDPCSYVRFCPDDEVTCRVNFLYPPGMATVVIDRDGFLLNDDGKRVRRCSGGLPNKGHGRYKHKNKSKG